MSETQLVLPLELEFDTGLDSMAKSDFEQALELADMVIRKTQETKNPYIALDVLLKMERLKNMTAIAKAKILHFLNKFWHEYQIDVPFLETVKSYVGLSSSLVIKRYISIWDMFDTNKIPEHVQEELRSRPIKDLVPIMGALNQGYVITEDDWDKITRASSFYDIARIVREEVKELEPRSHAIEYYLDKRTGRLYSKNQGNRYHIGNFILTATDPVVKASILRAINKIGIQMYDMEEE